jgi:ferredoxin-NADP reductase
MLTVRLFDVYHPTQTRCLELAPDTPEYLLGSSPDCAIYLPNLSLGAIVGSIKNQDGQYYFYPVSRFNLYFNNESATETAYPLASDDLIRLDNLIVIVDGIPGSRPKASSKKREPQSNGKARSLSQLKSRLQQKNQTPTPPPPPPISTLLPLKCVSMVNETPDVKTFRFLNRGFTYQAGQFITLKLNINGKTTQRCYTISSSPSRPHLLEITVKRVVEPPGLVSNWLHDHLQVGDTLEMHPPAGDFTCAVKPHPKLLFLSAGSGITPMMSMARWLYDTAQTQDVIFFHSAKTQADIIFHRELELLAAQNPYFHLFIALTRESSSGLTGRLDQAMLEKIAPDYRERAIYVCGPEAFMSGTKNLLQALNFPPEQYFEESFGGSKATPTTPAATVSVQFSCSGQSISGTNHDSILELAEQAGISLNSSCRSGFCGSCKVKKTQGEITYNAEPRGLNAEEEEAGYILSCIAYGVTEVTLDI